MKILRYLKYTPWFCHLFFVCLFDLGEEKKKKLPQIIPVLQLLFSYLFFLFVVCQVDVGGTQSIYVEVAQADFPLACWLCAFHFCALKFHLNCTHLLRLFSCHRHWLTSMAFLSVFSLGDIFKLNLNGFRFCLTTFYLLIGPSWNICPLRICSSD